MLPWKWESSKLFSGELEPGRQHNSAKVLEKCLSTSAAGSPLKYSSTTPLGLYCVCANSISTVCLSFANPSSTAAARFAEDSVKFLSRTFSDSLCCIFVHECKTRFQLNTDIFKRFPQRLLAKGAAKMAICTSFAPSVTEHVEVRELIEFYQTFSWEICAGESISSQSSGNG